MNQIKIGKFIAERRKAAQLTQRQLADLLHISDKTVSKWECGNGLPEVGLMLPLCALLGINVNELLSGEALTEDRYQIKAEENMMQLIQEKKESKKKLILSCIIGGITVVAMLALALLAALLPLPTAARIALIAGAVGIAAAGIGAAVVLDREAGSFECPNCRARFVPTMDAYVKGVHTITRRRLTCPACGRTGMCRKRVLR